MKVKEKIHAAIDELGVRELSRIYDYINALKLVRSAPSKRKMAMPIEMIHDMTKRSKSSWSNEVVKDREDRI